LRIKGVQPFIHFDFASNPEIINGYVSTFSALTYGIEGGIWVSAIPTIAPFIPAF
jgi:hypothetical protein